MHKHFFHWHERVQFKIEPITLEARWNSSGSFVEKAQRADVVSLLRLFLFQGGEMDFAKKFTDFLVKADPTFPIEKNNEILRVMASAGISSQLEKISSRSDSFALGIKAGNFPSGRANPVTLELISQAEVFLIDEAERMRQSVSSGEIDAADKKVATMLVNLKKVVDGGQIPEIGKNIEEVVKALMATVKDSHTKIGNALDRVSEENQYLWWLLSKRSSELLKPRKSLSVLSYVFPSAYEAANRVAFYPPATSVESLLPEVLGQCTGEIDVLVSLQEILDSVDKEWVNREFPENHQGNLTPVSTIVNECVIKSKDYTLACDEIGFNPSLKLDPTAWAVQCFREFVFIQLSNREF